MLSTVLMVPLVEWIGRGQQGFRVSRRNRRACGGGGRDVVRLFCGDPERVVPRQEKASSFLADLKDIARNDQWRIVGGLTLLNILAVATVAVP